MPFLKQKLCQKAKRLIPLHIIKIGVLENEQYVRFRYLFSSFIHKKEKIYLLSICFTITLSIFASQLNNYLKQKNMARTVNYSKRVERIKEQLDELVSELENNANAKAATKEKIKLSEIDFDNVEVVTLMQIQARISRIILEKSK